MVTAARRKPRSRVDSLSNYPTFNVLLTWWHLMVIMPPRLLARDLIVMALISYVVIITTLWLTIISQKDRMFCECYIITMRSFFSWEIWIAQADVSCASRQILSRLQPRLRKTVCMDVRWGGTYVGIFTGQHNVPRWHQFQQIVALGNKTYTFPRPHLHSPGVHNT